MLTDEREKADKHKKHTKGHYEHLRESGGAAMEEETPRDDYRISYFIMMLLGCGFLIPYQAFITAVDYFTLLYPTRKVEYTFVAVYMVSVFITLMLLVKYYKNASFSVRILGGFSAFLILVIAIPALDLAFFGFGDISEGELDSTSTSIMFWIMLGVILCTGTADAIVQGSTYGIAAFFPPEYAQAIQSGNAIAGIVVCILRIITKVSFPFDVNGLRRSAIVYFAIAAFVLLLCIFAYIIFIRLPFTIYCLSKNSNKNAALELLSASDQDIDDPSHASFWESFKPVFRQVWRYGLAGAFTFTVTLFAFPGMLSNIDTNMLSADWFPIIIITDFSIFDFVGKSLPSVHKNNLEKYPEKLLYIGTTTRVLMIPLFIMCMYVDFFQHVGWPLFFTALFALTNGYYGSIVMMIGPSKVDNSQKELAGTFMSFTVIAGLTLGALLSWILQLFITW